jgi:hypothetical protein
MREWEMHKIQRNTDAACLLPESRCNAPPLHHRCGSRRRQLVRRENLGSACDELEDLHLMQRERDEEEVQFCILLQKMTLW